jgi:hypothetical protein
MYQYSSAVATVGKLLEGDGRTDEATRVVTMSDETYAQATSEPRLARLARVARLASLARLARLARRTGGGLRLASTAQRAMPSLLSPRVGPLRRSNTDRTSMLRSL